VRVSDLQTGFVSAKVCLRNGEKSRDGGRVGTRIEGRVVEKKGEKYLIGKQSSGQSDGPVIEESPRKSYGPGTRVNWHREK
jgi:hypothetical protein